jgi:AraC-like DNA-binding protein
MPGMGVAFRCFRSCSGGRRVGGLGARTHEAGSSHGLDLPGGFSARRLRCMTGSANISHPLAAGSCEPSRHERAQLQPALCRVGGIDAGARCRAAQGGGRSTFALGTRLPVKRISQRCGFGSEETMRLSFLRLLSATPQDYRARFRGGRVASINACRMADIRWFRYAIPIEWGNAPTRTFRRYALR